MEQTGGGVLGWLYSAVGLFGEYKNIGNKVDIEKKRLDVEAANQRKQIEENAKIEIAKIQNNQTYFTVAKWFALAIGTAIVGSIVNKVFFKKK